MTSASGRPWWAENDLKHPYAKAVAAHDRYRDDRPDTERQHEEGKKLSPPRSKMRRHFRGGRLAAFLGHDLLISPGARPWSCNQILEKILLMSTGIAHIHCGRRRHRIGVKRRQKS